MAANSSARWQASGMIASTSAVPSQPMASAGTTPTHPQPPSAASHQLFHHHHHHQHQTHATGGASAARGHGGTKGHQRRQSVARLLPDISKLRLLSWLVEASAELINCDIAIMDGVYAKLNNRSKESLLFWQQAASGNSTFGGSYKNTAGPRPQRPPPPRSLQLAPNKSVISQQQQPRHHQQQQQQQNHTANNNGASRGNIKSSVTAANICDSPKSDAGVSRTGNCDAITEAINKHMQQQQLRTQGHSSLPLGQSPLRDSIAPLSAGPLSRSNRANRANSATGQEAADVVDSNNDSAATSRHQTSPVASAAKRNFNCARNISSLPIDLARNIGAGGHNASSDPADNEHAFGDDEDDDEDDDDDDSVSASSSATSSGTHGTSISSSSSSSSTCSFGDAAQAPTSSIAAPLSSGPPAATPNDGQAAATTGASSAELLSERIRCIVLKNNYLQNLLVNIIRIHDDRRRYEYLANAANDATSNTPAGDRRTKATRIDLADIASALDDGCQCSCHSELHHNYRSHCSRYSDICNSNEQPPTSIGDDKRASTLPTAKQQQTASSTSTLNLLVQPVRKNRRLKKMARARANSSDQLTRDEIIRQLSERLCENCFDTHYWLYDCTAMEMAQPLGKQSINSTTTPRSHTDTDGVYDDDLAALRNATFIKLVQQQVRSILGKSIELIDLIRKEIKSPESIKQKQLMRSFSDSIQLLSSVANYVVPAQDISSFIPDFGQQQHQQQLYNLPNFDFDHIQPSFYAGTSLQRLQTHMSMLDNQANANYHLAPAPQLPIRRRLIDRSQRVPSNCDLHSVATSNLTEESFEGDENENRKSCAESLVSARTADGNSLSSELQEKLKTKLSTAPTNDLSLTSTVDSGAASLASSSTSSKNSSASSSIARGSVQLSSQRRLGKAAPGVLSPLSLANRSTGCGGGGGGMANTNSLPPPVVGADHKLARTRGNSYNFNDNHLLKSGYHHQSASTSLSRQVGAHAVDEDEYDLMKKLNETRTKFWQSSKFNFIKKLLQVKQQRLLKQQSKDRRIYNNKVQNKFRLVMMDLTHFNRSQQLLSTENGVNSLLTSMRNVLEFGLYLTLKLY